MHYKRCICIFFIFILFISVFLVTIFAILCEPCQVNLNSAVQHYNENDYKSDIIISFTTMPLRLQSEELKHTLHNMFNQTMRPKEIRFNIPYHAQRTGMEYVIPTWLKEMPINIVRCETDYGPATKYIPTLQDYQETDQKILIYDDDSYMPSDLIEIMDKLSKQNPNYAIATTSAWFLPGTENTFSYKNWVGKKYTSQKILEHIFGGCGGEISEPNHFSDTVNGWSGFLISPNMLDLQDVSNFDNMPKAAFFVDDIVISAALLKKGTKIIVGPGLAAPAKTIYDWIETVTRSSSESLYATDNKERKNDIIMEQHFKQYWQFLK